MLLSIMLPGISGKDSGAGTDILRKPSSQTMEELRSELVYERAPDQSPTLSERIRAWVAGWISRILSNRAANTLYTWAWYIFFGILLIFAIIFFFRSEINAVFNVRDSLVNETMQAWKEEEIAGRDFLQMASDKAAEGDYRTALRFRYLHLIQQLADGGLINWRPDKTNRDYQREISDRSVNEAFRYMTYLFNYTWYGHFSLDESTYDRAVESLMKVENEIGQS
jgi:hypothetical protein